MICAARRQGTAGGNDPADCDWPNCGCEDAMTESTNAVTTDPRIIVVVSRLVEEATETIKELSDIVKVCTKILRFGPRPSHNGVQYDNVRDLELEMTDAIRRMREASALLGINFYDVITRSYEEKVAPDDAEVKR